MAPNRSSLAALAFLGSLAGRVTYLDHVYTREFERELESIDAQMRAQWTVAKRFPLSPASFPPSFLPFHFMDRVVLGSAFARAMQKRSFSHCPYVDTLTRHDFRASTCYSRPLVESVGEVPIYAEEYLAWHTRTTGHTVALCYSSKRTSPEDTRYIQLTPDYYSLH